METKINKWLRENKSLSIFLIIIFSITLIVAGDVISNTNDNVGDWFDTKNITRADTNRKSLDEITNEYGGSPQTMIIDLGNGEESYSIILIEERIVTLPIPQPTTNTDDFNCVYGMDEKDCFSDAELEAQELS